MLYLELKRLEIILEDGVTARNINREEQLQEARNRQQRFEETRGNGGNFFNSLSTAYTAFQGIAGKGIGLLANQANNLFGASNPSQYQNQYNNTNPYAQNHGGAYGYPPQQYGYPGQPGFQGYPGQPGFQGQPGQQPGYPSHNQGYPGQ